MAIGHDPALPDCFPGHKGRARAVGPSKGLPNMRLFIKK